MLCLCHLWAQPAFEASTSLIEKHAQEFRTAKNVRWDHSDQVTFAQFSYQDQFWVAYYDANEQLVATARKVNDLRNLPIRVGESLEEFRQQRAAGMKTAAAYELIQRGYTQYLINLDGEREMYTLIFDSMGGRISSRKTRKAESITTQDQPDLIARKLRVKEK